MARANRDDRHWHFSRRDLSRCGADGKRLFVTVEDAAVFFGVSKSTVLQWVNLGAVPYHSLGGRVYLNREEVQAYWNLFQRKG